MGNDGEGTLPSLQAEAWTAVLEDIRSQVGPQRLSLWFSNLHALDITREAVTVGVPNLFVRDWLASNFSHIFRASVATQFGRPLEVDFKISPKLFQETRRRALDADAGLVAEGAAAASSGDATAGATGIRPEYTLERFVVGPCNKLAQACAQEIIHSDAHHLHPLFVHAPCGLGKTHLLQAIWHAIRRRRDGRTAVYVSAESFTNQFVYAMRRRRLDGFRHRYRTADVLLVDDVHFLSTKRGLQEELLHTYDAIASRRCLLVLASDAHPKLLTDIKQNLLSRFASGMIVRLSSPSKRTRLAILKAKARELRQPIPSGALRFIAECCPGSIRDLIGALTTVAAYASLTREPVSLATARRALARTPTRVRSPSDLAAIERAVGDQFNVEPARWHAQRLTRTVRFPRQVCMYVARQCSALSCREIARYFNTANHSSVIFATKRVEQEMRRNPAVADKVAAVLNGCGGN
jgi:chromosomal replication initiator protein